ncbi:hypothetical protein RM543_12845 [Roseicyclus sp. F158]|uniref:Uncharacterized protein n=1 Tax=Tropicimonas omnivorans TaxID=3075590 RepID=A0ABU3DKD8_9RHOB|nr:hypothetical protein [Roseicyclus sp. F158]MDT0683577.1 hypothetical protein [Roseicyclus sp. F158]
MADTRITTRFGADEPEYFRHSPVSGHFSHLLAALAAAIEAERDIEDGLWSDPGFDHWLRQAELGWERASGLCRAIIDVPATRCSDVPLQRFARHLHWTLGCETAAELRTARQIVAGHPDLFSWSGNGPEERRVAQMLARGRQQFHEVCMLDMLNPVEAVASPEACSEYEPFAA